MFYLYYEVLLQSLAVAKILALITGFAKFRLAVCKI